MRMSNAIITAPVKRVCRQQIEGLLTKDLALLDRIPAPTAVFSHLTGEQQTKSDWLQQLKIGRLHYFSSQEVSLKVTVTGNEAEADMRNLIDARIYGFRNVWALEAQLHLQKHCDQWQLSCSRVRLY